jgi:hypothetical protein
MGMFDLYRYGVANPNLAAGHTDLRFEAFPRDQISRGGRVDTPCGLGGESHPEAVGRIANIRIVIVAVRRPDVAGIILP